MIYIYTGYTQKNGAVSVVKTIETAPFFCVYSVYIYIYIYIYTSRSSLSDIKSYNVILDCSISIENNFSVCLLIRKVEACRAEKFVTDVRVLLSNSEL
jgi:hypothetical protein